MGPSGSPYRASSGYCSPKCFRADLWQLIRKRHPKWSPIRWASSKVTCLLSWWAVRPAWGLVEDMMDMIYIYIYILQRAMNINYITHTHIYIYVYNIFAQTCTCAYIPLHLCMRQTCCKHIKFSPCLLKKFPKTLKPMSVLFYLLYPCRRVSKTNPKFFRVFLASQTLVQNLFEQVSCLCA